MDMRFLEIEIADDVRWLKYSVCQERRTLRSHVVRSPVLIWNCNCHIDSTLFRVRPCYIHTVLPNDYAQLYGRHTRIRYGNVAIDWSCEQGTRPSIDTAHLLRVLLPWVRVNRITTMLDLAAGSGLIGIAVMAQYDNVRVDFCDSEPREIRFLRRNLRGNFPFGDSACLYSQLNDCKNQYDLIVMNPPYIQSTRTDVSTPEFKKEALFDDELVRLIPVLLRRTPYLMLNISSVNERYQDIIGGMHGDVIPLYSVNVPFRIPQLYTEDGLSILYKLESSGRLRSKKNSYHPHWHMITGVLLGSGVSELRRRERSNNHG